MLSILEKLLLTVILAISTLNNQIKQVFNPDMKGGVEYVQTDGQSPTPLLIEVKTKQPTITPALTLTPTKYKPRPTDDGVPWGVAKQLDEHTWTMKVQDDEMMSTTKELLLALNSYRRTQGVSELNWDEKLANYAQSRADYLESIKTVDGHKGFMDYLEKENGFEKLGFDRLGENISYGYKMTGVHLIEWIYAADEPHNKNQLNKDWNYVGIGIKGTATCLIFGTGKH